MLALHHRVDVAILTLMLFGGLMVVLQFGPTASAQTAPPPSATGDMFGGSGYSCGLVTGGLSQCWGSSSGSQLGSTTSSQPAPSPGATGDMLVAGQHHSCGLVTDGLVQCWGENFFGQLGDDTTTGSPTPVTVTGLAAEPTALTAGGGHTCALLTDGQVQCWGANHDGQLGNGTTTNSTTPATVTGLAGGPIALTAGTSHTCALLTDGQVQCWGRNSNGQLGNGTTINSTIPVSITGLAGDAAALTAGWGHTCALFTDGQVQCWGLNGAGQLGNGTTTSSAAPVAITGLAADATALTAGWHHTCAVLTDGKVQCWGGNVDGQLGNGTTINSNIPITVTGLAGGPSALTAGQSHTCALLTDGQVQCWGANYAGQLGDGTNDDSSIPVSVTDLTGDATVLTAGVYHACAVLTDGQVQCWGYNADGQLGDGTTDDSPIPVTVSGLAGPVLRPGAPSTPPEPPSTGSLTVGSLAVGSLPVGSFAS